MTMKSEVEQELRMYLEKEPSMIRQDRLSYLLAIFDKHLIFNTAEHRMQYYDVFSVISGAKHVMGTQVLPIEITSKRIEPNQAVNVALLESFINFLNQKELLKKLVKIDYTQGEK